MKIKVVFDREKVNDKLNGGWGISLLIDDKVLFDTGEKGEYLLQNMDVLGVDIDVIEKVVISHNHWDHCSGLWDLLKKKESIEVLVCSDFIKEFKDKMAGYKFTEVKKSQMIDEGIYTTGCLRGLHEDKDIYEQFLVVKGERGISLICGCSHPGILTAVKKVKSMFPGDKIYSVLGGFHLMEEDRRAIKYIVGQMKKLGVEKVGPSHCSGFEAGLLFKEVYKENFIELKAGTEIEV
jgi:7,8-dihydropterin-6-yl-methyl-4-(beta-D-ribofuranosyl)aminobenzene 5'-phosphate synthase